MYISIVYDCMLPVNITKLIVIVRSSGVSHTTNQVILPVTLQDVITLTHRYCLDCHVCKCLSISANVKIGVFIIKGFFRLGTEPMTKGNVSVYFSWETVHFVGSNNFKT